MDHITERPRKSATKRAFGAMRKRVLEPLISPGNGSINCAYIQCVRTLIRHIILARGYDVSENGAHCAGTHGISLVCLVPGTHCVGHTVDWSFRPARLLCAKLGMASICKADFGIFKDLDLLLLGFYIKGGRGVLEISRISRICV